MNRKQHIKFCIFALLIACCALLVFSGCKNPFHSPESVSGEKGMGTVTILFGGNEANNGKAVSRTIFPGTVFENFISFLLYFYQDPEYKTNPISILWDIGEEGSIVNVSLKEGIWHLDVTAYMDSGDPEELLQAATGHYKDINVMSGSNPVINVKLSPIDFAGEGTFSWDVGFDAGIQSFKNASMEIWRIEGDTKVQTVDFIKNGGEPVNLKSETTLDAGEYRVLLKLTSELDEAVVISEVLQVYYNMISRYPDELDETKIFIADSIFTVSLESIVVGALDKADNLQKLTAKGIKAGHFGFLGINGFSDVNYSTILQWFDTICTASDKKPGNLGELKELTDVALIGAASADFHLPGFYPKRENIENALKDLALNGTGISFNWADCNNVNIQSGSYNAKITIINLDYGHDTEWELTDPAALLDFTGNKINGTCQRIGCEFAPTEVSVSLEEYIRTQDGLNPVELRMGIDLETMLPPQAGNWRQLLAEIAANPDKFVALDLSECYMSTSAYNFCPDNTVSTGKDRIVSIKIPDCAISVYQYQGTSNSNPILKYFDNLKKFYGGTNLKTINNRAFCNLANLEEVTFSAAVTIDGNPFSGCSLLASFNLTGPGSLDIDGGALIQNVSGGGVELISYPSASGSLAMSGITGFASGAFEDCSGITAVSFPDATGVGNYAFQNCAKLTSVTFDAALDIGVSAFQGCTSLASAAFPVAVSIDDQAFQGCTSLVNLAPTAFPVTTNIGVMAFFGCTELTSASFPEVTTISSSAFYNCIKLSSADFPVVTQIESSVFQVAYQYQNTVTHPFTITLGPFAPNLDTSIFSNVTRTITVKIPDSAAGYSPFTDGDVNPVTGSNSDPNWANGLRGMGWNGSIGSGWLQSNLTVEFVEYSP